MPQPGQNYLQSPGSTVSSLIFMKRKMERNEGILEDDHFENEIILPRGIRELFVRTFLTHVTEVFIEQIYVSQSAVKNPS